MTAATVKATVVKKPKTFCSRTSAECMIGLGAAAQEKDRGVKQARPESASGSAETEYVKWRATSRWS
jgi:hypothetical protein